MAASALRVRRPGAKYGPQVVRNGQPTAEAFIGLALEDAELRDFGEIRGPLNE